MKKDKSLEDAVRNIQEEQEVNESWGWSRFIHQNLFDRAHFKYQKDYEKCRIDAGYPLADDVDSSDDETLTEFGNWRQERIDYEQCVLKAQENKFANRAKIFKMVLASALKKAKKTEDKEKQKAKIDKINRQYKDVMEKEGLSLRNITARANKAIQMHKQKLAKSAAKKKAKAAKKAAKEKK